MSICFSRRLDIYKLFKPSGDFSHKKAHRAVQNHYYSNSFFVNLYLVVRIYFDHVSLYKVCADRKLETNINKNKNKKCCEIYKFTDDAVLINVYENYHQTLNDNLSTKVSLVFTALSRSRCEMGYGLRLLNSHPVPFVSQSTARTIGIRTWTHLYG